MSYQGGEASSYQGGESASYQGGGGYGEADAYGNPYGNNVSNAGRYAKQNVDSDSDDEDFYSSALNKVMAKKDDVHSSDDDVQTAESNHRKFYSDEERSDSPHDIGTAAAVEAFNKHRSQGESGGMNAFIGMAMAEAAKLFSKQGGGDKSNKSEALQAAAMMAFKLYASKSDSGHGSSGGGLGSMIGMLMAAQGGGGKESGGGGIGGMVGSMLGGGGKKEESHGGGDLASKLIGKLF